MNEFVVSLMLLGALSTSGSLPYWATTGQWGLMPENNGSLMLLQAHTQFDTAKTFQWHWGASLAANTYNNPLSAASSPLNFMLDELYVGARWKVLRLDAGCFHRELDFMGADPTLGSLSVTGGHLLESGNARTMPGYLATLEPLAVPFTGEHLWIYGAWGDFKMTDLRYINGPLVHRTRAGIRGDIGRLSLSFTLDHAAMWAGDLPDGSMPITLDNYIRVVTGRSASASGSGADQINVIGNQLGSELFKAEYRGEGWKAVLQHDIPYDDGSGMGFQNFPDGVNTLAFSFDDKDRWVSDIVLEYQYSLWQSGTCHDVPTTEEERQHLDPSDEFHYWHHVYGGGDDYFNHEVGYLSGWTHYGRTIGNPLFLPAGTRAGTWTSAAVTMGIESNRLSAWHMGIGGKLFRRHPYRLMLTHSSNYGTYKVPYVGESIWGTPYTRKGMVEAMKAAGNLPLRQWCAAFNGTFTDLFSVRGLDAVYGLYVDAGSIFPKRFGATLGIKYTLGRK